MPDSFDPNKFINCSPERKRFEDMLHFKTPARVLSIESPSGTGKSQLLAKFKHRCFTERLSIPVSLIQFDPFKPLQPIDLVRELKTDLDRWIKFPTFERAYHALLAENFSEILNIKTRYHFSGTVNASQADLREASNFKMAGILNENVENLYVNLSPAGEATEQTAQRKLSEAQRSLATDICVHAFTKDLTQYLHRTSHRRIVLLFDRYEACDSSLSEWLMTDFFLEHFYDMVKPSRRLLTVIAGQTPPAYKTYWSSELFNASVISNGRLSPWAAEDVDHCLKTRGVNEDLVNRHRILLRQLAEDVPPVHLIQLIDALAANG